MEDEIFPRHYADWKKCITEKCKISLTKEYIEERIRSLSTEGSLEKKTFIDKYGPHWHQTILGYFHQAHREKS